MQTWQHNLVFAHDTKKSGGLIIGMNRSLSFEKLNLQYRKEQAGQALLLHAKIKGIELVLINVYVDSSASRTDFAPFLEHVQADAEKWGCPNLIWCGDFNSVIDVEMDCTNQNRKNNAILRSDIFANFVERMELADTYRTFNLLRTG